MKRKMPSIVILLFVVLFSLVSSSYRSPEQDEASVREFMDGAGGWTWSEESITATIIPQNQLPGPAEGDWVLLQSNGINVSGPTRLCRAYPGGQSGWIAEIRYLTNTGWQGVATTNQWVPDEEGTFMSCAQVWVRGTYALFGYWERPEGWCSTPCPPEGYTFFLSLKDIRDLILSDVNGPSFEEPVIKIRCGEGGTVIFSDDLETQEMEMPTMGVIYCCNDNLYILDELIGDGPMIPTQD